jgi:hypothetical protein
MEVAQNSPSQIWGPYLTASATMTITDNGSTIFNNTSTYTSGSATYSVTSSVNFQSGHTYIISASNQPADCCTPTITSASISGSDISIFFTTGSGCTGCTATTVERSVDGSTWTGANTAGCTSPRVLTAPTSSMYYRIQQNCGAVSSSFSNSYYFVSGATYNYYDVTRFDCPDCTNPAYSLVARNNTTGGTLTTSHYYNNGDGYVYRIDGYNAGTSYTINLDGSATSGTNCSATCAI